MPIDVAFCIPMHVVEALSRLHYGNSCTSGLALQYYSPGTSWTISGLFGSALGQGFAATNVACAWGVLARAAVSCRTVFFQLGRMRLGVCSIRSIVVGISLVEACAVTNPWAWKQSNSSMHASFPVYARVEEFVVPGTWSCAEPMVDEQERKALALPDQPNWRPPEGWRRMHWRWG